MLLIAGKRRVEVPITCPQDALEFADAYSADPAALYDLVNVTIEGEGAQWVREALQSHVWGVGNSSRDALIGLLNIIRNSSWLTDAPHLADLVKITAPVIAVASGPSLEDHIDELRELQSSCLIIGADTALKGLRARGINPHISTPMERDAILPSLVPPGTGMTYAGSIVTEPVIPNSFDRQIAVPSNEPLGRWVDPVGVGYGSSTGTMAVEVGLNLTSGPVYLVGHDLSYPCREESHWKDATSTPVTINDTIMGYNGKLLPTVSYFRLFCDQIATMAISSGRVFDPNISRKKGARILGAKRAELPKPGKPLSWNPVGAPAGAWRRLLSSRIALLPGDLAITQARIARANAIEQLSAEALCGGVNMSVVLSLFRPIWAQFSCERRLGMTTPHILEGMREAMMSVISKSRPFIEEACNGVS